MAEVAKALGDPVRLQLVDVLRKHAGKVCVCELVPLFDISQPTVSHHLKELREAGIVGLRARGPVGLLLRDPRRAEGAVRMAELDRPPCCTPELRPSCCEPEDKAGCCGHDEGCGCAAGTAKPSTTTFARSSARATPLQHRRRADAAATGCCRSRTSTARRCSAPRSTATSKRDSCPTPRSAPRSAAASRPRSPTCTRARPCSTSARAPAPTS